MLLSIMESLVDKLSDLLTSALSASGSLEKSKTNINRKIIRIQHRFR